MSDNKQISPVFLLGAGRSGTKFVRSLLAASDEVNTIPFDVGYVWRYGNESVPHDELTPDMASEKIIKYIRKTLPQLVEKKQGGFRFYVEKSVPNTLRPAFMHKVFPKAKFIHLIRDGRAVTESAIRLWQEPPEGRYLLQKLKYFPWSNYRYALWYLGNQIKGKFFSRRAQLIWGPRYEGMELDSQTLPLEIVCARQWRKCVEVCHRQLQNVDDSQVLYTRYESLMTDERELQRICDFLELSDADKVLQKFRATANETNLEKWKNRLSDSQLKMIVGEIEQALIQFNYL